jgi:hypothetical protein
MHEVNMGLKHIERPRAISKKVTQENIRAQIDEDDRDIHSCKYEEPSQRKESDQGYRHIKVHKTYPYTTVFDAYGKERYINKQVVLHVQKDTKQ